MKVSQTTSSPVQNAEAQKTAKADSAKKAAESKALGKYESVPADKSVRAEISSKAKEFSKAKSVADAAPDVREDRVADLKKRINSGQYKIDADAIADKMFEEHSRLG